MIEFIVVIAILAIISGISWASFRNINNNRGVDSGSVLVRSILEDARSRTLASRDDSQYGVHFESGSTTLFVGTTFSSGDPLNEEVLFPTGIQVSTISLTGGASDIVFGRLTGTTSATGTIIVSLISDSTATSGVTIQGTGLIMLE